MERKGKGESILGKMMSWINQERSSSTWWWEEQEVKDRSKPLAQQKEGNQYHRNSRKNYLLAI